MISRRCFWTIKVMWEYEYKINTAIEVRLVSEAEQIKLRFKSQVKF